MITVDRLRAFAPAASLANLNAFADALEDNRTAAGLTTPGRLCHFMAQIAHESGGLTRLEEGLSYSADRLTQVWPKRFPTLAAATPYARNPVALANKVYGGRMGNTQPGDGYRFRGRGLIQLTGKDNYTLAAKYSGFPLVEDPGLAANPSNAARIALGFWKSAGLNDEADRDDIEAITRVINGGLHGLDDRKAWLAKARKVFK